MDAPANAVQGISHFGNVNVGDRLRGKGGAAHAGPDCCCTCHTIGAGGDADVESAANAGPGNGYATTDRRVAHTGAYDNADAGNWTSD